MGHPSLNGAPAPAQFRRYVALILYNVSNSIGLVFGAISAYELVQAGLAGKSYVPAPKRSDW